MAAMISSLVIRILANGDAAIVTRRLLEIDGLELGPAANPHQIPAVLECDSPEIAEETCQKLGRIEGVAMVEVVAVFFDQFEMDEVETSMGQETD